MNKIYSRKKMNTIELLVVILFIIFSIPACVAYLEVLKGGGGLSWSYGVYKSDNIIEGLLRYGKDIIVSLIFVLLFLKGYKRLGKYYLIAFWVIMYGVLIGLINDLQWKYYLCGVREFLYVFVAILLHKDGYFKENFIYKITSILEKLIYLEVIAQLVLFIKYNLFHYIGVMRLPALQASAISLGYYVIGIYSLISAINIKFGFLTKKRFFLITVGCLFLAFSSGTRTAILSVFLIGFISLMENIAIPKKTRYLLIIFGSVIVIPLFYNFIIDVVGRGNIMDSGGGRIDFWQEYLSKADNFQKIFGVGLGALTNNAANMSLSFKFDIFITDGTFNIAMTQFGFLGVYLYIILFTKYVLTIMRANKRSGGNNYFFSLIIVLVTLITMTATNIFEQGSFIIFFSIAISIMISKNSENIINTN